MEKDVTLFLSHSWQDKAVAQKIAEQLDTFPGFTVWVDYFSLLPGDPIQQSIDETIENTDVLLLLWSQHSATSDNVKKEIEKAVATGCLIIPLVLGNSQAGSPSPALPGILEERLWVDVDPAKPELAIPRIALSADQLWSQHLPEDLANGTASNHGAMRQLSGFFHYLAEYQRYPPGHPERLEWIRRAAKVMAQILDERNDPTLTLAIQQATNNLKQTDPDAADILHELTGDTNLIETQTDDYQVFDAQSLLQNASPLTGEIRAHIASILQKQTSRDAFRDLISQYTLSTQQRTDLEETTVNMVCAIPDLLDGAGHVAVQAGIGSVIEPVLQQCIAYFLQPNDLIPDEAGLLGLLDDSYLATGWLHYIAGQYQMTTGLPLFNVDFQPNLQILQSLIGSSLTQQLDAHILQTYQVLAMQFQQELALWNQTLNIPQSYHHTPGGWGNSWESEMARMAATMGMSLDF